MSTKEKIAQLLERKWVQERNGLTDTEIALELVVSQNTVRGRRQILKKEGTIKDLGQYRINPESGSRAKIWYWRDAEVTKLTEPVAKKKAATSSPGSPRAAQSTGEWFKTILPDKPGAYWFYGKWQSQRKIRLVEVVENPRGLVYTCQGEFLHRFSMENQSWWMAVELPSIDGLS